MAPHHPAGCRCSPIHRRGCHQHRLPVAQRRAAAGHPPSFHIDFAQCFFAEVLGWRRFGETNFRLGNQEAIGAVMVGKLKRAGVRLPEIRYIDRDWDRLESILSRFSCSMFLLGAPWLGIWGVVVVGLLGWAVARAAGV